MFRLPKNNVHPLIQGEMIFVLVDVNMNYRHFFETTILKNRAIYLKVGTSNQQIQRFYVSDSLYKNTFELTPFELIQYGYTYTLKIKSRNLLFGGYGIASVEKLMKVEKQPTLIK